MPHPVLARRLPVINTYPMLAANLAQASAQSASIADNASLSMGASVDTTLAGWAYLSSNSNAQTVISKWVGSTEYLLWFRSLGPHFRYQVSNDGVAVTSVSATTFGAPPTATWMFLVAQYDGTNIQISVNNGAFNQQAFSADIFDGTGRFTFGSADGSGNSLDGRLDSWGLWKSARGSGGALSAAQITRLYKGGVGMAYRDLDSSLKTGLISWWNFDGDLNDSHGTNNLTNNNAVTFTTGKR